jgi:hypothetical protein
LCAGFNPDYEFLIQIIIHSLLWLVRPLTIMGQYPGMIIVGLEDLTYFRVRGA